MTKSELRHRAHPKARGDIHHDEKDDPNWPYDKGQMSRSHKRMGIAILVFMVSLTAYFRYQQYLKDIVITPLASPSIINSSLPSENPEMFWGSYR